MITSVGGVGAGLVCGWLVGLRVSYERPSSVTLAAAASFVFAGEALALAGWRAAAALLAAVPAGLLVQSCWRAVLRHRYLGEGSFRA